MNIPTLITNPDNAEHALAHILHNAHITKLGMRKPRIRFTLHQQTTLLGITVTSSPQHQPHAPPHTPTH